MSEHFETKKISQETLGEYLYAVRQQLGLSASEVSMETGILEKFLIALEQGRYQVLPPDAYVLGFLKKLANLYKISCDDLLEQYKKEKGVVEQTARQRMAPSTSWLAGLKQIVVTPKLISVSVGVLVVSGSFLYVLVQVFSVNRTPALTILEPTANTVLAGSSIDIKGKTDPGISLTVNGQNVLVQADGSFATTLGVAPGQKDFQLVAKNKFGKERAEVLSLRVDEPQVAGDITELPSEFIVELYFIRTTTIFIKSDDKELTEEIVPAGATKKIVAQDRVELTTSDAGGTQVTFNGVKLPALGRAGQKVTETFNRDLEQLIR
ncbi:MAG TPA: DUF4115 domain-containing protein [Candidatus Doudnabacteria bacterium]|nr:DUF4115 domain-containing protein [Candidatus Doudnabacteria bacterium]